MSHLKKPFFVHGLLTHVYVGDYVTAENITETKSVERHDHTAANGATAHCLVGSRDFYEFMLRWIDATTKTDLETLWGNIKDGTAFTLVWDDSVRKMDGTWDMDGTYTMGTDSDGNAIASTEYVIAQTEMTFTPEEVDGYHQVMMRVREKV